MLSKKVHKDQAIRMLTRGIGELTKQLGRLENDHERLHRGTDSGALSQLIQLTEAVDVIRTSLGLDRIVPAPVTVGYAWAADDVAPDGQWRCVDLYEQVTTWKGLQLKMKLVATMFPSPVAWTVTLEDGTVVGEGTVMDKQGAQQQVAREQALAFAQVLRP